MLKSGNRQMMIVWNAYLDHLSRGIVTIRSVLDCEVVIGGMLAPFLADYLEELRALVGRLSPFDADGAYVRLCRYRAHSAGVGALGRGRPAACKAEKDCTIDGIGGNRRRKR